MAARKLNADWLDKMIVEEKKRREKSHTKSREAERWAAEHKDKIKQCPAAPEPDQQLIGIVASSSDSSDDSEDAPPGLEPVGGDEPLDTE
jgi:hypothetical protein